MAIQFSGGTIIHEQVDAGTKAALIAGLRQALLDAGWTQTGGGAAYTTGTFTGLPSNTQTVTIDGTVYTFKSALANAYDVKIGADGTACASNLVDAIMDNSANEGTTYGTGTNAHPTCSASYLLGVITVTYRTAGISGNGVAVSKTLSNFTWAWAALQYGGSILRSVTTPDGLSMKLRIDDDGTAYARITPFSSDEAISGVSCFLAVSASRLLEVQACRYQIMVYLLGSSTTASTCFFATVPKLRTVNVPSVIASVADDGSGKFQVTTATAHGLATGQHVYIDGAQGVVGLNGAFQITVTGDST